MSIEDPLFLVGDAQNIKKTATQLVDFISAAKTSIHIAIYDFRLSDPATAKSVIDALVARTKVGVEVRIAYDHRNAPKFGAGDDPAPHGTNDFLTKHLANSDVELAPVGWTKLESKSIAGSKLMHSKYVVRDGHTPDASVWMGSANFTDDAWTKQDNNILILDSAQLAAYYETDFNELWSTGTLVGSGVNDFGTVAQDGMNVDIAFSPGEGRRIDGEIADLILSAQETVHIASMVISSDAILNALSQVLEADRVTITGIFDGPQMGAAEKQMKGSARSATKVSEIEALRKILVAKKSHPYTDGGVHDFMHNKLVVVDDTVITGSHNFSLSATHNAENAVLIRDGDLAEKYRAYVESLVKKYGR